MPFCPRPLLAFPPVLHLLCVEQEEDSVLIFLTCPFILRESRWGRWVSVEGVGSELV